MKCPRCGYERKAEDVAPDWQCPSCQVAYVKAQAQAQARAVTATPVTQKQPVPPPIPSVHDEEMALEQIASGQRIAIYSIVINFAINAIARASVTWDLGLLALSFAAAIFTLTGVVRISSGLGLNQNQKIVAMVLACVPVVNIIQLLVLSARATRRLRAAGWQVGLFGARS